MLTDERADHDIMSLFRGGVVGVQKIADVASQWNNPTHDWGNRTVWRLLNATTFALTDKVSAPAHRPYEYIVRSLENVGEV